MAGSGRGKRCNKWLADMKQRAGPRGGLRGANSVFYELLLPAGELYDQIRVAGRLEEGTTRFYAAEVVLMLEALRREGVVHRCAALRVLCCTEVCWDGASAARRYAKRSAAQHGQVRSMHAGAAAKLSCGPPQ